MPPPVIAACFSMEREKWTRTKADSMPARTAVPAKLSHRPVSPRGHKSATRMTGKTRAVETEMRDADAGFSTASI